MKNRCNFNQAWAGHCNKECDDEFCEDHKKIKCKICGGQAVKTCKETFQFVCGTPLCGKCKCGCRK